jgi:ABC-type hemin transport system ATPase subunit
MGTVRTGVILKDVSTEAHGGELAAVLGSKGAKVQGAINNT